MLSHGDRLGSYEVVSLLGAGGMGVVYRAHDTRLSRDVALKVLPQGALADEAARRRFRNEAHALSRLSHPHIASLFDFDTTGDGTDFLVMELVSGPSLDARIADGPLPEKDVVRLGAQIVRALVAAHEQGIVHRDLKPQNVRLTADGLVKVLDFGLARIAPVLGAGETEATASGSIAGTPPYMSPEQLLGKEVDARTDVYAAGVLFYEMATGRRPYGETSGPQLVAKILTEPMPMPREANAAISPLLEQVIVKAADKDRELRHQTAKDLLVDLERLAAGSGRSAASWTPPGGTPDRAGTAPGGTTATSRSAAGARGAGGRTARRLLLRVAAAAGILVTAGSLATWRLRPGTPRITSFRTLAQRTQHINDLATDGVNAYFTESRNPTDGLFAVPLSGGAPAEIPLPWTGSVVVRVFDAFAQPPALLIGKRTATDPGAPVELWRLPLGGGSPSRLDALPAVHSARLSRKGDRVAYVSPVEDPKGAALFVAGIDDRRPRRLAGPHAHLGLGTWRPGDDAVRLLSTEDQSRFLDVSTEARMVWPEPPGGGWGVLVHRGSWAPAADWTPDGRFFVWADAGALLGRAERLPFFTRRAPAATRLTAPSHVTAMRFTPDGRRIVALVQRPGTEVVRFDPRTGEASTLLGGARAGVAEFSPDGSWVAWVSNDGDRGRLWRSRPDGSSALQLTEPKRFEVESAPPVRWSPDGRRIAFTARGDPPESAVVPQLFLVDVETGAIERLVHGEERFYQTDPCWTPDGRALIYGAVPLGPASGSDLYLHRVDLATRQVTLVPGSQGLLSPKCASDGRILATDEFTRQAHSRQGAVRDDFFKLWRPDTREWTPLSIGLTGWFLNYPTWTRDGRFVYANALAADRSFSSVVRFDVATRRVETIARIDGFRADLWMDLAPDGVPLVHRDASQHEVVVMEWEAR